MGEFLGKSHCWPKRTQRLISQLPKISWLSPRLLGKYSVDCSLQSESNVNPLRLQRLSGSDDGSKWWLLYSLLHPTTKHFNRLIWDILSSPAPESTQWWSECLQLTQLTQGGSKVRRSCQSTIVGGACTELRDSDRNLRTAWFEKGDFKIGILQKPLEKWILHPMTPLNPTEMLWHDLKQSFHAWKPSNVAELKQFCKEEWAKIPPQGCERLIASYRKRLIAVVAAKGGTTSY